MKRRFLALSLTTMGLLLSNGVHIPVLADKSEAVSTGNKGAEVYCFMRSSGNTHEVSWNAAYETIKRQKSSLFKTSPKHAAVMIIETVVKNPGSYGNCGNYLGDMFSPSEIGLSDKNDSSKPTKETATKNEQKGDRYSY